MVNPFRRWFGGARESQGWAEVSDWAESNGHRFAPSRGAEGFVVDVNRSGESWRIEWGPPQRHYFSSSELRIRGEVGATGDLQMLVMSRELMSMLEQQVFEESTDGTETRMDDDLPEEMRWLVLYPKVPRAELGTLRERIGALSNFPRAALSWLDKPLLDQLDGSPVWQGTDGLLVLVVNRGRLTLRCTLAEATLPAVKGALALFGGAMTGARRVGAELREGRFGNERPSGWGPPSTMPDGG